MILANVRSLKGLKMDELRANATFFNEYRDACLMAFTETWFEKNIADRGTFIKGFGCPARLDRDKQTTGKEKGGVFVYMSTSVGAKPSLYAQHICDVIQKHDAVSTDAPKFILGDFNQCKLENCLSTYHHYNTCPTRMNKTIDLCYGWCPLRIGR